MFDIIWSVNAVEEIKIKRSWKERLFSLPWRPFVKNKISYNPIILQIGNKIIAHPSYKGKLKFLESWRFQNYYGFELKNNPRLWDVGV